MGPGGAPYVLPAQLASYGPATALSLATSDQQTRACLDATEAADSMISGRFGRNITAWGNDLTRYTAWVAWFYLMNTIGFAPQAGSDVQITRNYQSAMGGVDPLTGGRVTGWFEKIQRQSIQPDITPAVAVGADPGHDAPQVSSLPMRGWQQTRGGRSVIGGM